MHESNEEYVKSYIDSITFENNFFKIEGWTFHEKLAILPLRIKTNDNYFDIKIKNRQDVGLFYDNSNILNCGWYIDNIPNKYSKVELEINIENEWKKVFDILLCNHQINYNNIPSFVVIDDVYVDPDSVRNFALSQTFNYHPNNHKGRRTDTTFLFNGLKDLFESKLNCKIKNWEYYGTNGCFQYCIAGEQLVYHFDAQQYAGVLFLTPDAPPQTGTTFYRSKYTKKMKVSDNEHSIVFKNGFYDSTEFDVVDVVGNVYNRIVLFDARMIHAASCYFGTNIDNGRLFQLFFFDLDL
jgi:hypothetical protein